MKVVSLFSGAGGLDLGFIMAGHTIIWANDLGGNTRMAEKYAINAVILAYIIIEIKNIIKLNYALKTVAILIP